MKKEFILALFSIFLAVNSMAQVKEEDAIKRTVNNLFAGMKSGDSILARAAFADKVIMQTVVGKDDGAEIQTESLKAFLTAIGSPRKQKFDERIVFTKILIDGPLASVWTDYKFYVDDNFSHCGVNSFQLVKGHRGWQIVYIIDTRRKDNCKS